MHRFLLHLELLYACKEAIYFGIALGAVSTCCITSCCYWQFKKHFGDEENPIISGYGGENAGIHDNGVPNEVEMGDISLSGENDH